MTLIFLRQIGLLCLALTITSCGGKSAVTVPDATPGDTPNLTQILEQSVPDEDNQLLRSADDSSTLPASDVNVIATTDYVLGPEDLIEITVFQVDELNRTMRISSSGYIKLPLLGKVKVSGLTVSEFEAELNKGLEPYLQEPVVSVFIEEYRSQRITMLGAVRSPQVHTVTRQNYLLDIVTLSGGLASNAGEICYIRRGAETIIVNMDDLLAKGNTSLNVPVYAGDVIHVPVGGILFVDGGVRSPGPYSIRGKVTVTQAITMARGFSFSAKKGKISVYRENGNGDFDIIPVDYKAILANEAPDLALHDKDILLVQTSLVKTVLRTMGGAVRLGQDGAVSAGD